MFTDADVDAVKSIDGLVESGWIDPGLEAAVARAAGQSCPGWPNGRSACSTTTSRRRPTRESTSRTQRPSSGSSRRSCRSWSTSMRTCGVGTSLRSWGGASPHLRASWPRHAHRGLRRRRGVQQPDPQPPRHPARRAHRAVRVDHLGRGRHHRRARDQDARGRGPVHGRRSPPSRRPSAWGCSMPSTSTTTCQTFASAWPGQRAQPVRRRLRARRQHRQPLTSAAKRATVLVDQELAGSWRASPAC